MNNSRSLEKLKQLVREIPVLCYHDPKKDFVLMVDVNSQRFRTCILQGNQPIVYPCRALTDSQETMLK